MDRFIVREPRIGADYPQGNHMVSIPPNSGNINNIMVPETMYFGGYGAEYPVHRNQGFMAVTHVNAPNFAPNMSNQNRVMSGIDPHYLATYADNSVNYIAGQRQQMEREPPLIPAHEPAFGTDYLNRRFIGADRAKNTFAAQPSSPNVMMLPRENSAKSVHMTNTPSSRRDYQPQSSSNIRPATPHSQTKMNVKENEGDKTSIQIPAVKTRAERLRDLQKTGSRVFSGPVEKVLKWHKALQDLGLLILYEFVGKCVSVRSGESCGKALVVRDESGPAMQVVYYEIDFLLPELKIPCIVRVLGRMMPGTCRFQAFSVRPATGDDVSTLPRRAAVAAHHVSKLCKEFQNL